MNLIEIINLSKTYYSSTNETKALDNININVEEGKIYGVLGPSGCGKSTLFNILTNLEKPTSGNIKYNKQINIGYMMQTDALLPWLSVYDNCLLGLKLTKSNTKENQEYVNQLLKKYNLYNYKDYYPNELSGGMRQRVALIRTLSTKPNILLLDEPFSALDITSRLSIIDDVYKIIKELKITTILVSHDISESISLCDEIIILTKSPGKIKSHFYTSEDILPSKRRDTTSFYENYDKIWKIINE